MAGRWWVPVGTFEGESWQGASGCWNVWTSVVVRWVGGFTSKTLELCGFSAYLQYSYRKQAEPTERSPRGAVTQAAPRPGQAGRPALLWSPSPAAGGVLGPEVPALGTGRPGRVCLLSWAPHNAPFCSSWADVSAAGPGGVREEPAPGPGGQAGRGSSARPDPVCLWGRPRPLCASASPGAKGRPGHSGLPLGGHLEATLGRRAAPLFRACAQTRVLAARPLPPPLSTPPGLSHSLNN